MVFSLLNAVCILQLACLEGLSAGIALIAARLLRTALGTDTFDISVGKELSAFGAVVLVGFFGVKVALLQERLEDILYDIEVVLCVRLCE